MEGNTEAAIARMEQQIKELARRMDSLEKLIETVQTLALSVKELSTRQESTEEQLGTISKKVTAIEEKPAKYWSSVITAVISALVGAAIAYFIKGGQ